MRYNKGTKFTAKIAYISDQQYPIEKADSEQVINTVSALGAAGVDITLVIPRRWRNFGKQKCAPKKSLTDFYGVNATFRLKELVTFPLTKLRLEKYTHCFVAPFWAKYKGYDIIYTRNPLPAFISLALGLKVVFETYRNYEKNNSVLGWLLARCSHHPDFLGVITHSRLSKRSLLEIGIQKSKVVVIHNGFNPDLFIRDLTQRGARRLLNLPSNAFIACYSGRLDKDKGVASLITLAARTPDILYLFIGKTQKDPCDWIEKAAQGKGLTNVKCIPWMQASELTKYLVAADVLLIPPTSEPLRKFGKTVLPLKLFLYLAASRPILAPDLPDIQDILHAGNAKLIEPDDMEAATKGMRTLFLNKILAGELAKSAKLTSVNFSWQQRAQKIILFVRSCLEQNSDLRKIVFSGHSRI